MKHHNEKMPRLVAERHAQPVRRSFSEYGFSSLLSRWERPGEGACISTKLEHLSTVALAKVEAIKANLRGLGYGG